METCPSLHLLRVNYRLCVYLPELQRQETQGNCLGSEVPKTKIEVELFHGYSTGLETRA